MRFVFTQEHNMEIGKTLGDMFITAEQAWRAADHIIHVTFPVVQDAKLLLRALEHLDKATRQTLSVILKYEYIERRVRLSHRGQENIETFFTVCAPAYSLDPEDRDALRELLVLGKRHRDSGIEFSQKGKMFILDDAAGTVSIAAPQLSVCAHALRRLQLQFHQRLKRRETYK